MTRRTNAPIDAEPTRCTIKIGQIRLNGSALERALAILGFAATGRLDATAALLAAIDHRRSDGDTGQRRGGSLTAEEREESVNPAGPGGNGSESAEDRDPTRHEHGAGQSQTAGGKRPAATPSDRGRWIAHLAR
jgi:hypothetical protein